MSEPEPDGYECRDCDAEFPVPSISQGPKFVDQETGEVDRWRHVRARCPECLSLNVWLMTTPPRPINQANNSLPVPPRDTLSDT